MTRVHQLERTLRTLKLGGMLDTLEARLAQARAGELGHLEFLQVLCEDEIARRQAKALRERVRRARFEEPATLEDFDFAFNPKLPVAQIRDLATCRFLDAGESIILYGPVGVGKTHLAQALGHLACRRGHQVRFAKTSRLLAELAGGHADHTWETRLRKLTRLDLLILDDFGLREFTPQQGDDLFELVSERHKTGSMILTSNRAPGDWYGLFPNPVVAEGALDRLVNCAHHVLMQGKATGPTSAPVPSRPKEVRQARTHPVGVSDSLIDPLVNSLIVHTAHTEALTLARGLDGARQEAVLVAVAPDLPAELLGEAVQLAGTIRERHSRARALAALAPHLPAPARQPALGQALDLLLTLEPTLDRDRALVSLVAHLPTDLLRVALDQLTRTTVGLGSKPMLCALANAPGAAGLGWADWRPVLTAAAAHGRPALAATIAAISPVLARFAGPDGVRACRQALADAARWWP